MLALILLLSAAVAQTKPGASTTPTSVTLAAPPAATSGTVHVQILSLATLPAGSTTATLTLSGTPTQVCIIQFSSSVVGQDMFTAAAPCQSSIVFTLPTSYTTWAAAPLDTVTVIWW